MADPLPSPQSNLSFFVTSLAGHNSNPIIPDAFFSTHLEGKNELMKLKLTSDAFDTTWEVKLNGRRFASGWEDFSAAHCLRDDDVLVFKHDGDMGFHVTPSGRSFSQIHCISSSSADTEDDNDSEDDDDDDVSEDDDDDSEDGDDDNDDSDGDDDDVTYDDSDSKNIASKNKLRGKAESSYTENSCLLAVTPSNLRLNRVSLTRHFTRTNGLNERWCEIDLMNQSGKSWALGLRHNKITGQDFIRGGWRSFCRANELKTGSCYRFKLVRNGTRPVLQFCSDFIPEGNSSIANGKAKVSAKSSRECESASTKQNKFLTVTLKLYMLKSRQLRLPRHFVRENGIKPGEITLVSKNGVKWSSYVASYNERREFYMTKNWISCCAASGIKTGETFTLEFVREEGTTPMLKFCSKAKGKIVQAPFDGPRGPGEAYRVEEEETQEETETRFQKRARVSVEGGPSCRNQASNKSTADPKNLQRKQPLQSCAISDQVKKVKQSILDTLTDVRRFRTKLEIKEQNLEASLQEIDALGEKVLEINNILNSNKI